MKIPVENLFYLLCYAWDALPQRQLVHVEGLKGDRVNDLLATVLVTGLTRLLRQGLERHYQLRRSSIPGIRGKLEIADSIKQATFIRGRAVCSFFELNSDTPANRILKATARSLLSDSELDKGLHGELARLFRGMHAINDERLQRHSFRKVQYHRNNRLYRFLINICSLWLERSFVDEKTGQVRFREFERTDENLRVLFERFVRNFYSRELPRETKVRPLKTRWSARASDPATLAMLPELRTDICLVTSQTLMVIDTKYTKSHRTNRDVEKLKEPHLFQLFAYLMNLSTDQRFRSHRLAGMLLYPMTDHKEDSTFNIHGYPFLVRHLNLAQPWELIAQRLHNIHGDSIAALAA
ncbi:hypothetical protein ACFL0N_01465 [Pseudomonadota bacterium]